MWFVGSVKTWFTASWAGVHTLITQSKPPFEASRLYTSSSTSSYWECNRPKDYDWRLEHLHKIKPRYYVHILRQKCISLGDRCNTKSVWFFKDLLPMLGTFHLSQVLLQCTRRYLTRGGVDGDLVEKEVLVKKVVRSVLSDGHYRVCLLYLKLFIRWLGKPSGRPNNIIPVWFSI